MKFEYGDIVFFKKLSDENQIFPMQIISFDNQRKKYLCLNTTEYSPGDYGTCFYFISEAELSFLKDFDAKYSDKIKIIYNKLFPKNINLYYFDLYELDNDKISLVRKACLRRKEFHIPTY